MMIKTEIFAVNENVGSDIITWEKYQNIRKRRRRRVAKRMEKRFPLFAVEFMKEEFSDYDFEQFVEDIKRPKRKIKKRKGKSPLKRQGRYPLMMENIKQYESTGNIKYLHQAQKLRNRINQPFEVVFSLNGKRRVEVFPSTASVEIIKSLAQIKFDSWEMLDSILEERLRYAHLW